VTGFWLIQPSQFQRMLFMVSAHGANGPVCSKNSKMNLEATASAPSHQSQRPRCAVSRTSSSISAKPCSTPK